MFELNGTQNLYSDHYTGETTLDVSYQREVLNDVASIGVDGEKTCWSRTPSSMNIDCLDFIGR